LFTTFFNILCITIESSKKILSKSENSIIKDIGFLSLRSSNPTALAKLFKKFTVFPVLKLCICALAHKAKSFILSLWLNSFILPLDKLIDCIAPLLCLYIIR
jgi:hypothetical protein